MKKTPFLFFLILLFSKYGFSQNVGLAKGNSSRQAQAQNMRGYYIIPARLQGWDLQEWKAAFDCFASDGINAVIFWIPGSFRSKKFPETWQYNTDHKNIQNDFYRELIDYAHLRGIKVILGFSPFAYDGVNQYPSQHPETRGKNKDGTPIDSGGIFSFGYSMCPAVEASQQFMFDYIKEMTDDFYPNADGLFIESTDYGRCQCGLCKDNYYDYEFKFVRRISDFFWAKKPGAPIVIYPHYFSGASINTENVKGTGGNQQFDNRWSLFFTPHSTDLKTLGAAWIKRAQHILYYDASPIWVNTQKIRESIKLTRKLGITYFPTFEGYEYKAKGMEYDKEAIIVGHQLKPFGLEWLPYGKQVYNDPLVRLNRIAYRVFYKSPDLSDVAFKEIVRKEMFGKHASPSCVEDLFYLQDAVLADRQASYFFASPLIFPERLYAKANAENWDKARIESYLEKVKAIRKMAQRHVNAVDPVEIELQKIAAYIVTQWDAYNKSQL